MQKQRSWWVLRRLYSISQTRRTFMNNLFYTYYRGKCLSTVFTVQLSCSCVITHQYCMFLPERVTPQEVHMKQMGAKPFPTSPQSALLSITPLLASAALSCVWLYLNEHVLWELGGKQNIKQGYISYLFFFFFQLHSVVPMYNFSRIDQ